MYNSLSASWGCPREPAKTHTRFNPHYIEVSKVSELGEALAKRLFHSAGRTDVGHEARQHMLQVRLWTIMSAPDIARRKRESFLRRASRTVRSVGRLVRKFVRNGAQGNKLTNQVVRIQTESF